MAEIEVIYKTKAELSGAKAVEEQLEREIGKAKALGKEYKNLEDQLKRVRDSLKSASSGDSFGKALSDNLKNVLGHLPGFEKLAGIAEGIKAGPVVALGSAFGSLAAVIGTAAESLRRYASAQQSVVSLDAALANSGQLTNSYRQSLQKLASTMGHETATSGQAWLAVLTRLTQFGARPENIEKYAEAVKNLAGIMGGDIEHAGVLFSKAIQGHTEMLGRYGIVLDHTGTKQEQLNRLMEVLAQRGGGQLEARAGTLSGQFEKFGKSIGSLIKALGQLLDSSGVVGIGLENLGGIFTYWAGVLGTTIPLLDGITNKFVSLIGSQYQADVATKAYTESMTEMKKAIEDVSKASDAQINVIEHNLQRETAVIEARKKLAIEQIKLSERDPEKQSRAISAAEISFGGAAAGLAQDALRKKIAVRSQEIRDIEKTRKASKEDFDAFADKAPLVAEGKTAEKIMFDVRKERDREAGQQTYVRNLREQVERREILTESPNIGTGRKAAREAPDFVTFREQYIKQPGNGVPHSASDYKTLFDAFLTSRSGKTEKFEKDIASAAGRRSSALKALGPGFEELPPPEQYKAEVEKRRKEQQDESAITEDKLRIKRAERDEDQKLLENSKTLNELKSQTTTTTENVRKLKLKEDFSVKVSEQKKRFSTAYAKHVADPTGRTPAPDINDEAYAELNQDAVARQSGNSNKRTVRPSRPIQTQQRRVTTTDESTPDISGQGRQADAVGQQIVNAVNSLSGNFVGALLNVLGSVENTRRAVDMLNSKVDAQRAE